MKDKMESQPDRQAVLMEFLNGTLPLSPEESLRVDPLMWKLQEEYMYLWHRTKERGLISEILSLAHRFQALGREKGVSILTTYGQELEERTLHFDLAVLDSTLNLYPNIIKALNGWIR